MQCSAMVGHRWGLCTRQLWLASKLLSPCMGLEAGMRATEAGCLGRHCRSSADRQIRSLLLKLLLQEGFLESVAVC
jgi:hypothetical protein